MILILGAPFTDALTRLTQAEGAARCSARSPGTKRSRGNSTKSGWASHWRAMSRSFPATAAPRLYGNQMVVVRSEYEGHVEASGERFLSHDIHAAVREVARRAQATVEAVA